MDLTAMNARRPLVLLSIIALGIVIGGLPAVISSKFLPYFIGVCLLLGIALFTLIRPVFLLYFVILTSTMAALLRSFESFNVGSTSITVSGFRWVFIAGIVLFIIGANIRRVRLPWHFLPFVIFVFFVIVRWLIGTPIETIGLKDILFYSLPPLIGVYTLFVLSASKKPLVGSIEKAFLYSVFIPLFLYVVFIASGLVFLTEEGPKGVIGPRPVATYLLIVLSLSLAEWRYAKNKTYRVRGSFISLLSFGIIVFTLSRTATATALLLFAVFKINPIRLWKVLPSALLAIILSVSLLLAIPPLRARLFHVPPSNLAEAYKYLQVSGRNKMWPATFNHALEKPIFGWGPGSARLLVGGLYPRNKEIPPHNEYLQVFHDTGIIGLVLLLSAWLLLIVRYWKRWKFAHLSKDILRAKWNMAATLSIILVLINAIFDNTLHYTFIIAPVFIIIGCTEFLSNSIRHGTSRSRAAKNGVNKCLKAC